MGTKIQEAKVLYVVRPCPQVVPELSSVRIVEFLRNEATVQLEQATKPVEHDNEQGSFEERGCSELRRNSLHAGGR